MFRIIGVLLKRDINEKKSGIKNIKKDVLGAILSIFLIILIVGTFVFAFSYFVETYSVIKIGYITNKVDRVYEILTLFYSVLFILLIVLGVNKLNKNLTNVGNKTFLSMPISPFQIYFSKVFGIYLDLAATSVVISVPVFILIAVKGLLVWPTVFVGLLFALVAPVIALGIASLLTIPYYFMRKWLSKHFVLQLIAYILFMIGAFLGYSIFLRFIKDLIESGQITFFFNEKNVLLIGNLCRYLVPANLMAAIFINKNVFLNLILIVLIAVAAIVACYFMSKGIFGLVAQNKMGKIDDFVKNKHPRKQRKVTSTLMAKEFLNILRTPNYAFSYFAIVIALPLMVVVTTSLMCSMMRELTLLNCDFEIVLCSICMYSILLNSFCANNISRDGKFFNQLKTLPVSPKTVVFSKIYFCSITSTLSIIFSGVAVLIMGTISPLKTLVVVVICTLLNVGVICLATKKDLNSAKNKRGEENSSASNFLIFWGLIFSIILTVVSFVISLYLQMKLSLLVANIISCVILLVLSLLVLGGTILYLLKDLDKKYKEMVI